MAISEKRTIITIKRGFNKHNIMQIFRDHPKVDTILNVKDKQNVPHAVQLFDMLNELDMEGVTGLELDVYKEIKVFNHIGQLLLSIFRDTTLNLLDQLVRLSELGFILLIIYRQLGTDFMTNALYLDIQSTIQDAFVVASRFKVKGTDGSLLLYMLGTDLLELLFCSVRTTNHASNCDFLELNDKIKVSQCFFYSYCYNQLTIYNQLTLNLHLSEFKTNRKSIRSTLIYVNKTSYQQD